MRATIDAGGRVVIPKGVRERLGLEAGTELELVERDGWLEITVVPTDMRLTDAGNGPTLSTDRPMPVLTAGLVRDTVERLRR